MEILISGSDLLFKVTDNNFGLSYVDDHLSNDQEFSQNVQPDVSLQDLR